MADILTLPLFSLCLTLGAYLFGLWCRKKVKRSFCNPFLIATVLVGVFLILTKMPMADYQKGMEPISWLLTPATVALAVPLYEQTKALKRNLPAILVGVVAGAISSLLMVLGLCILFALPREISVSLLPKSITTAIGMVLAEQGGGIGSLTAGVIAVTGITGVLLGPVFCKLFRLRDPICQGVAYGTASHVLGTSKALEVDPLAGAVSSLSLVVAGLLTAVILPLITMWI